MVHALAVLFVDLFVYQAVGPFAYLIGVFSAAEPLRQLTKKRLYSSAAPATMIY